jgi:hypothetical protein
MSGQTYLHRGGKHIESTTLMNALAHAGVIHPGSREPFGEAAVFGLAGGIGAGLSFCPSVLRYGLGAGITVVGRYRSAATDGGYHKGLLERLGVPYRVTEASTPPAAQKKLVAELERGRPVLVQCSQGLPYHGGTTPATGLMSWAWDVIVYRVDEGAGTAEVGDLADATFTVSLDDLARVRNQTCTHKNRSFVVEPRKKMAMSELRAAYVDAIGACVTGMREPRIKTLSLEHLPKWAGAVRNLQAKSGWRKTFAGGTLYWALRDVFASIETKNTGGGLIRGLYAEFLREAAKVTGKKALEACASDYDALAGQWSALAEAALPGKVKEFKKTKELMRKQVTLFADQAPRGAAQLARVGELLAGLGEAMVASFPEAATAELLAELAERIEAVHKAEVAALDRLARAVA